MALTQAQAQYVAEIRFSEDPINVINTTFENVGSDDYADRQFREWLFAIDATNRVASERWYEIMIEGLMRHSPWLQRGVLQLEALSEIEEHTRDHGAGEYAIETMITLIDECKDLSNRAESVTRALFAEHFNGIQPLTEHALFVLKRYLDPRRPLNEADIELLLHITEETKGLDNARGAQAYLSSLIKQAITNGTGVQRRQYSMVFNWIASRSEFCEAEVSVAELLATMELPIPAS